MLPAHPGHIHLFDSLAFGHGIVVNVSMSAVLIVDMITNILLFFDRVFVSLSCRNQGLLVGFAFRAPLIAREQLGHGGQFPLFRITLTRLFYSAPSRSVYNNSNPSGVFVPSCIEAPRAQKDYRYTCLWANGDVRDYRACTYCSYVVSVLHPCL
ncbi:hypothetical protein B0H16DRAFT_497871 [Mycena metata]|uniref:Uncharacterized protein n=1 Tax=Mycena metata TaxID=1033252 RepID=A0AAD7H986_9AGAR|nr:hypothetical protein B0H16DRAFT_497871 [Mycena metata]